MSDEKIDLQSLQRDLAALGVQGGDRLMVHASLRSLGLAHSQFGVGGPQLLLNALEAAVGPSGTLLMILGSDYAYDWVNQRPVEERAGLLQGTPPFDARTASVLPEVGWFAEVFRQSPGTVLSNNPSGRFAARGRDAQALLSDQPWNDYYGPGSPLEKLCERGGKVLRLGADPNTVTVLHYAEYLARVPNKRKTRWDYLVLRDGVPAHVWVSCLDDAEGIADWDEDYFAVITNTYIAQGRGSGGHVARAQSELLDAADFARFGAAWMEKNFR
jgi:aminoglycoside N3'-acetyltransferase